MCGCGRVGSKTVASVCAAHYQNLRNVLAGAAQNLPTLNTNSLANIYLLCHNHN